MQLRLSSAQFQVHLRRLVDFQGVILFHPLNHREEASKGLIGHRSKSAQRMKKYRQNIHVLIFSNCNKKDPLLTIIF